MSEHLDKQAVINWLEEQIHGSRWPYEVKWAFRRVGNEVGSDRFDSHGIENVSPETREEIGRELAEIRAEKAESEIQRLREENEKLKDIGIQASQKESIGRLLKTLERTEKKLEVSKSDYKGALQALDEVEKENATLRQTLTEIKECIPAMQDTSESESVRHNMGNYIIHKIDQLGKGE